MMTMIEGKGKRRRLTARAAVAARALRRRPAREAMGPRPGAAGPPRREQVAAAVAEPAAPPALAAAQVRQATRATLAAWRAWRAPTAAVVAAPAAQEPVVPGAAEPEVPEVGQPSRKPAPRHALPRRRSSALILFTALSSARLWARTLRNASPSGSRIRSAMQSSRPVTSSASMACLTVISALPKKRSISTA